MKGREREREKKRRGGGGGVKEKRIPDMLQKMEGRKKKKGNRQDWVGHAIPVMLQGGAADEGFFILVADEWRCFLQNGNLNCTVFYIYHSVGSPRIPGNRGSFTYSVHTYMSIPISSTSSSILYRFQ